MATESEATAAMDKAAGAAGPFVRRALMSSFDKLNSGISEAVIEAAMIQRTAEPIFGAPAWLEFIDGLEETLADPEGPMLDAMKASHRRTAAVTPQISGPLDDGALARQASAWIRENGAELVTQVSETTKGGIRQIIATGFDDGRSVKASAKEIKRLAGFGLTERQSASIGKLRLALTEEGKSAREIGNAVGARVRKLKARRAKLIAKTETYNAAGEAQRQLWERAAADGKLDANIYELEWVTRNIRVCPRCEALRGTRAPITGGVFESNPIDAPGKLNGTTIRHSRPTVHPDCYCALRVVRKRKVN